MSPIAIELPLWLWIVGILGTAGLAIFIGMFLGGLWCAFDQKREEKLRARAILALKEARLLGYEWLKRGDKEQKLVANAVLAALSHLQEAQKPPKEEELAEA